MDPPSQTSSDDESMDLEEWLKRQADVLETEVRPANPPLPVLPLPRAENEEITSPNKRKAEVDLEDRSPKTRKLSETIKRWMQTKQQELFLFFLGTFHSDQEMVLDSETPFQECSFLQIMPSDPLSSETPNDDHFQETDLNKELTSDPDQLNEELPADLDQVQTDTQQAKIETDVQNGPTLSKAPLVELPVPSTNTQPILESPKPTPFRSREVPKPIMVAPQKENRRPLSLGQSSPSTPPSWQPNNFQSPMGSWGDQNYQQQQQKQQQQQRGTHSSSSPYKKPRTSHASHSSPSRKNTPKATGPDGTSTSSLQPNEPQKKVKTCFLTEPQLQGLEHHLRRLCLHFGMNAFPPGNRTLLPTNLGMNIPTGQPCGGGVKNSGADPGNMYAFYTVPDDLRGENFNIAMFYIQTPREMAAWLDTQLLVPIQLSCGVRGHNFITSNQPTIIVPFVLPKIRHKGLNRDFKHGLLCVMVEIEGTGLVMYEFFKIYLLPYKYNKKETLPDYCK